MWRGQNGSYFLTANEVAVNTKSNHVKDAKSFVSFLLSDKCQSETNAIPVSKKTFKKITIERYNSGDGYGTMNIANNDVQVKKIDENTLNKFISDIELLNTSCDKNKLILDQTGEEFIQYISGENNDLDDTVNKISNKLQICLSE